MSGPQDIARRVREVFIRSLSLNLAEPELPYGEKLDEMAGLDSLAVLEFLTALEKEFGITLDPELLDLGTLRDLRALATYIENRLAAGGGAPRAD